MGSINQQYCLRWNNHRSNLLLVFEHLFHTEAFTDVTLACDGNSIKCHKMVLAACSSYFQQLFLDNDCRHPIVILKDILFSEVKAILEYMYKGEVNVGQDQLSGLLKAAETLKVKGLVEDHQRTSTSNINNPLSSSSPHSSTQYNTNLSTIQSQSLNHNNSNNNPLNINNNNANIRSITSTASALQPISSSSNSVISSLNEYDNNIIGSNFNKSSNHLSSSNSSLNKFTTIDSTFNTIVTERNTLGLTHWNSTKLSSTSPLSNQNQVQPSFENSIESPTTTFKRKKHYYNNTTSSSSSSVTNSNKDTPILRTVLGHTSFIHNSEPQTKSINYSMSGGGTPTSNGPSEIIPEKMFHESPEGYFEDSIRSVDSDKMRDDNHSFIDSEGNKFGIGLYGGSNQKPEWKRYKQYTRNDIMAAIDAVREGMSALQAARKYGVPSRTLYDKVKKLGITTNRPYRKGTFPMSPYQGLNLKIEDIGYSPEEPLDVSSTGNPNGNFHGTEGDSDKMDSDPGSSIKQEHSPPIDDLEESPHYDRTEESNQDNVSEMMKSQDVILPTQSSSTLIQRPPPPPPPPFTTYLNGSYFGI